MSASASLHCISPQLAREIWPLVRDRLFAAYRRTDLGHTADLEHDVLSGDGVLWIAASPRPAPLAGVDIAAALVAKLERTDSGLACVITAMGGSDRSRWLEHLSAIELWAKAEGATKVRFFGRKGWRRLLKNYQTSNVVLERLL